MSESETRGGCGDGPACPGLLAATERHLASIKARVEAGKLKGADAIGLRVGRVVNQYKVAKNFELSIDAASFAFQRKRQSIAAEAAPDGIYIIRTSLAPARMDAADCVRNYKALANVERAFCSLKTVDLKVRPIHAAIRKECFVFLRWIGKAVNFK